jgi:hypothetical protein
VGEIEVIFEGRQTFVVLVEMVQHGRTPVVSLITVVFILAFYLIFAVFLILLNEDIASNRVRSRALVIGLEVAQPLVGSRPTLRVEGWSGRCDAGRGDTAFEETSSRCVG